MKEKISEGDLRVCKEGLELNMKRVSDEMNKLKKTLEYQEETWMSLRKAYVALFGEEAAKEFEEPIPGLFVTRGR